MSKTSTTASRISITGMAALPVFRESPFSIFWDRRGSYPRPRFKAHPLDCSVMQYTGHEVLRTLIRCHFSPAETTGGQYIYSGGADGRIHASVRRSNLYLQLANTSCWKQIWSLDGRIVEILDRSNTLPMSFDPSAPYPHHLAKSTVPRRVCVRDVSWHSQVRSDIPLDSMHSSSPPATCPDECWLARQWLGCERVKCSCSS